jgi:hypothetical protein
VDNRAFSVGIRPYQHGQPRREVEHRVLVRHEVDQLDALEHHMLLAMAEAS